MTAHRICVEHLLPEHQNAHEQMVASDHYERLAAAFYTQKIWPATDSITIGFHDHPAGHIPAWTPTAVLRGLRKADGSPVPLDPLESTMRGMSAKTAIQHIITARLQPIVGLKFVWLDDVTQADVRISFNPHGGCNSLIGTDSRHSKLPATMNFGWLDVGTILHEFGHVLGLIHEHQNPGGEPIKWDLNEVYSWAKDTQGWTKKQTDKNIVSRYSRDQLNNSDYDPESIMLYFFPPSLTTNHVGTNANHILSPTDVRWISKIYPGGKQTPEEFYMDAYGLDINSGGGVSTIVWVIIILGAIAIVVWWWTHKRKLKTISSTGRGQTLHQTIK